MLKKNNFSKLTKKRIVVVTAIIVSVLIISLMIILKSIGILREFFPLKKQTFDSYKEFREITSDYFPDVLPSSASNTKYYYYEGHFDRVYAVSTSLSDEDFDKIINPYNSFFKIFDNKIENIKLEDTFIERENISFLINLIDDKSNYMIAKYVDVPGGSHTRVKYGVIVDQKQGNIIIFCCEDSDLLP